MRIILTCFLRVPRLQGFFNFSENQTSYIFVLVLLSHLIPIIHALMGQPPEQYKV